ncbi:MAG: PAS domain-containing protein [Spirochaetaceae bacterium]|nr:PAS domain-containing protein [Spirochaetaceae bacterium]
MQDWALEFPGAVTVCDRDYTVLYMNDKAAKTFEKWGGADLLGKSLRDCHLPSSIETMERILQSGSPNVYTIEKAGVRKLIYQAPWKKEGKIAGLVELSLEIPAEMPHFVRS